jgi:hypothetical protein
VQRDRCNCTPRMAELEVGVSLTSDDDTAWRPGSIRAYLLVATECVGIFASFFLERSSFISEASVWQSLGDVRSAERPL